MRVRPIHFVPDVAAAVRFYEALGLSGQARSRSGHWVELAAAGGELGLHDAAIADDGKGRAGFALNFIADEPLEEVERRLREYLIDEISLDREGAVLDMIDHARGPFPGNGNQAIGQGDEIDRPIFV